MTILKLLGIYSSDECKLNICVCVCWGPPIYLRVLHINFSVEYNVY